MQGIGERKIYCSRDGNLGRRSSASMLFLPLSTLVLTGNLPQFFLELWEEINHKAALRSRAVAASSLPNPKSNVEDVPEGTIFEELVAQYSKLVVRAEDMIVHTVAGEVEAGLKTHFSGGGSSSVHRLSL